MKDGFCDKCQLEFTPMDYKEALGCGCEHCVEFYKDDKCLECGE